MCTCISMQKISRIQNACETLIMRTVTHNCIFRAQLQYAFSEFVYCIFIYFISCKIQNLV